MKETPGNHSEKVTVRMCVFSMSVFPVRIFHVRVSMSACQCPQISVRVFHITYLIAPHGVCQQFNSLSFYQFILPI